MSGGSAPQDFSLTATWPDITPADSPHCDLQRLTYTEVVSLSVRVEDLSSRLVLVVEQLRAILAL